jgi:DNA replication initiation complex subunit (GINS family)
MELFKALSRERIAPAQQLAALRGDFYPRLRRFLLGLKQRVAQNPALGSDQLRATISARDLVSLRLSKLLHLTSGTSFAPDLMQKITPEERRLFEVVRSLVEEWRVAVLEASLP